MGPTAGKKRVLDESSSTPKAKKSKVDDGLKKRKSSVSEKPLQAASNLVTEEVDFPRGGGTSFTPLEVKAIRAEALKEANDQLFEDKKDAQLKRTRRKSEAKAGKKADKSTKTDTIRVEHLNYKRISPGMKIFGEIVSVQPLALVVSLPNQLFAHVPITNITTELTTRLEEMDEEMDKSEQSDVGSDDDEELSHVPDLIELFRPGQYVRAIVSAVHPSGASDAIGIGRTRDEVQKASRRVELSLIPEKINQNISKADLKTGFTFSASVKSVEDHGYILNTGIPNVSGFLSFKEAEKNPQYQGRKLPIGALLEVSVSKMSNNGRTCTVSVEPTLLTSASLSEVSNVGSLLPGTLVSGLVTAILPSGLNLQVVGYFSGTVDHLHLPPGDIDDHFKMGQKVKARILYDISPATPPRFALSLADHVVSLTSKHVPGPGDAQDGPSLHDAYPVGTTLESVKVVRVESERGLIVEVSANVEGFVHISQTSDDHVPTLSANSGPWKIGTIHRARVTGYFPFDGLLQLSMRPSVLDQKFLQVGEVQVGEVMKGTVKKLTDSALFVSISGNVDAVIWPNHYADIQLKHPQKRFKPGGSIKCRVLVVDPQRKRVVLTAKKSLIDSPHPIIAKIEDAQVGMVTHAVVFKSSDKSVHVEFYNNLKAVVPGKEASETAIGSLPEAFPAGKVVQIRVLSVDAQTGRVLASIRQASPNYKSAIMDISDVEIGNTVEGVIAEVQKDKVAITLQPTQVRALLSLNNLANRRGVTVGQLRSSLRVGQKLQDLVVTSRNPEKGFVLVATKPKEAQSVIQKGLTIDSIQLGQVITGRVLRHVRQGALVKVGSHITGLLHPTDTGDDYEEAKPFPDIGSAVEAAVIAIDKEKKQLTLSTRRSRMHPDQANAIVDEEVNSLDVLNPGSFVRGFIKSVAEHGLYVTLGRGIDARVQIKELFDDFVKDWKSRFSANQLVKGRILSVDPEKKQIEMTFRSSESKAAGPSIQITDLSEGDKVDGIVKKIEDYGLFIEIEGSKLRGLCHKSELSDNKEADVTMALRSFREGDRVKARVLSVDLEKRRISLGLKPSYFDEGDVASDEEDEESSHAGAEPLGVVENENSDDEDHDGRMDEDKGEEDDDEEADNGMDIDEETVKVDLTVPSAFAPSSSKASHNGEEGTTLQLDSGFQWSIDQAQEASEASSSEDDDDVAQPGKKKKRRKQIEQDLTAEMHTKAPESNADFERLLLGSPNSSYLWIQYMSFQLQLSEVDKAREIAKRALKTINFREEQEKLNVWIALLNLENVYGTDESLETTFKDAARHNDSKTVHLRMAAIFDQSEKFEKAEEQYKRTCKKFGHSSKVWTLFAEHYFKRGLPDDARKLLPRSLQSLEKRKHLKTISKFAQLEYKLGDAERGKTIFEGIVDSHPKRWDLWSIYIDMEAAQGDIASVRNLFNRVLALKMTSHKAKSFFKKWLELERRIGDEEGASKVKEKAIEWTQRAAQSS
ncbi:U3 snoRNP-associated protein Rrp5 [Panus rudis PR-1116 ss-1]|nr:U3 snoRNP-associated protein Rrp5 [Panus rudis PR-1116 ss-1]